MHSQRDFGCGTSGMRRQQICQRRCSSMWWCFLSWRIGNPSKSTLRMRNPQTQRNRGSLPELSDSTSGRQGKTTLQASENDLPPRRNSDWLPSARGSESADALPFLNVEAQSTGRKPFSNSHRQATDSWQTTVRDSVFEGIQ